MSRPKARCYLRFVIRRAAALAGVLLAALGVVAGKTAPAKALRVNGCSPASVAKLWNGDRTAPQVFGTKRVALRSLFFLPQGAAWSDPSHAVFTGLVGNQVKSPGV